MGAKVEATVRSLGGNDLKRMFLGATEHLESLKAKVDALNVFPVPDGDTGTNMCLTMKSACREISKIGSDSAADVAQALSLGALMGARGNSGVILSQLFRGLAKGLEGRRRATPQDLAWAFQEAVNTAYKAVMKPVEGTILTVAREHARAALQLARQGASMEQTLDFAQRQAEAALARTPELLPVLKQAGVVDAGGKGLVVIWEGALRVLHGDAEVAVATSHEPAARRVEFVVEDPGEIAFAYDVQFLLRGDDLPIQEIRTELAAHGDSLLVVGTDKLVKVHIHTNKPGAVLDYCLSFGDLLDVVVENMRLQSEALRDAQAIEAGSTGGPVGVLLPPEAEIAQVSVVSVAVGPGLIDLFRSQGASEIIEGGQTMNPSTEEIHAAFERVTGRQVIFIPNNGNILMAARQAAELSSKEVAIVPTKSIPDGFAALVKLNRGESLEHNVRVMEEAVKRARSGEVTYSVRSAVYNGLRIEAGDLIGLSDGEIISVGRSAEDVLADLAGKLCRPDDVVATVFYGSDVTSSQASSAADALKRRFPDLEIEFINGGQPLYYYLVSIE
jgi:DAK2 domain fusion protein YloV